PHAHLYALSLHDALPILPANFHFPPAAQVNRCIPNCGIAAHFARPATCPARDRRPDLPYWAFAAVDRASYGTSTRCLLCPEERRDRNSTRLNSSHDQISY